MVNFRDSAEKFVSDCIEKSHIPGLSVVVIRNGQTEFLNYGYANEKAGNKVDEYTLFEIASMSKAFTLLGLLLLKQQGRLKFSDPVSMYAPDLKIYYVDEESKKKHEAEITIENLVYHTSGIPFESLVFIPESNEENALEKTVKELNGIKLLFKPGTEYHYTSYNTNLLAYVIQVITDMSFEEYMKQNVLNPLGLVHTYMLHSEAMETKRLSKGYRYSFFKVREYNTPVYRGNTAAGHIISCAKDMERWMQIQMGIVEVSDPFRRAIEESHVGKIELKDNEGYMAACGWDVNGKGLVKFRGQNPNYTSMILVDNQIKYGVCVLTNLCTSTTFYIGEQVLKSQKPKGIPHYKADRFKQVDRLFSAISIIASVIAVIVMIYTAKALMTNGLNNLGIKNYFRFILASCWTILLFGLFKILPNVISDYRRVNWAMMKIWAPSAVNSSFRVIMIANVFVLLSLVI